MFRDGRPEMTDGAKMNRDPIVSVIVPTYNCARYIEKAIDSALRQTCRNIEVLVIDDGSTDDTQERLKRFGDGIRYIRKNKQGLSKSRNMGMDLSRGEFIAFLDADDVWNENKLEIQLECFREVPEIDMVFTNFSRIDAEGNVVRERYEENAFPVFRDYGLSMEKIFGEKRSIRAGNFGGDEAQHTLYFGQAFYQLCKGNFILPSTTLFRRRCIESAGIRWNEDFHCATDQHFHLHFARHFPIAYLDAVTAQYRIAGGNSVSSNRNIPQLIQNTIRTIEELHELDDGLRSAHEGLYDTVIGNHYAKLAYYYLSELDRANAKRYALLSFGHKPAPNKNVITLAMSFVPTGLLSIVKNLKSRFPRI